MEQTHEFTEKHVHVTTCFLMGDGGPKSLEYFTLEASEGNSYFKRPYLQYSRNYTFYSNLK